MLDAPRRRFVTYYRVSTDRQGRSGLGLEAQQRGVLAEPLQRDVCRLFGEDGRVRVLSI